MFSKTSGKIKTEYRRNYIRTNADINFNFAEPTVLGSVVLGYVYCIANVNKKHVKNVGPIRHCEPPHAHSADVASGTVTRRLRIDVHDNDDNENA